MNKDLIRSQVRAAKALLGDVDRRRAAAGVFSRLEGLAAFMMAERILMYHSLPDELSTREFIDRWESRKRFFLPRVNGVNLDILPYDRSSLRLGSFHIEEPGGMDTTDVDDIELIVVPAVAFDRRGNRVGRGKGYYDRLLAGTRALKVGVGYDFQLRDDGDIEPDDFDIPLDILITEHHTVTVRHSREGNRQ
ncbi:MAG: 5-formyltetrahydrofolate cyclo-ligase [Pseudoflavonifractor sp.]|nr:5-formyltetrahydrofolate cyclo-ligase [Pseudoflavonifractor sp.]